MDRGVSFIWFHPLSNNNSESTFATNLGINHSKKKRQENGKLKSSLLSLNHPHPLELSAFKIVRSIIMVRLKYTVQKKKKKKKIKGFVIVPAFLSLAGHQQKINTLTDAMDLSLTHWKLFFFGVFIPWWSRTPPAYCLNCTHFSYFSFH